RHAVTLGGPLRERYAAPGRLPGKRAAASPLDAVQQIGAALDARARLQDPAAAELITDAQTVDGFGKADAVAHVKPGREIGAEHDGGLLGCGALFDIDVFDAEGGTDALGQQ